MADPIDTGKKTVTGRTIWRDPETGEDYSERSTTFEIDGKYYTMPTVDKNGNQYSDDAIRKYVKENGPIDFITGEELPEFRYREDAIEYAISRSDTRKQKEEPMLEEQMELFNEGGLKDEGGEVDPESGNDVPIGSTKKEVRDDIPAMLSEGEFVFPADVVRYIGLENLMRLRQDAKMGLKKMEAMGQMGNSEEATIPDDMPFDMADLIIVTGEQEKDEPREMAEGGVVHANQGAFMPSTGIGGYQQSIFQNQPQVAAPFVPASSIAPPPPAPSPAGGFMPKFMTNNATPFDDGSLAPKTNTGTTSTTTTNTGTTGTTDDFVPTVDKVYTQKKYINPETGETRMINFYNNSPVNEIPEGFIPFEDYNPDETTTTDLESTSVTSTQVTDDGSADKKKLSDMVAAKQTEKANEFNKNLEKYTGDPKQYTTDLVDMYQTLKNQQLLTTGLGPFTGGLSFLTKPFISNKLKNVEAALAQSNLGTDWKNSEAIKAIDDMTFMDKVTGAFSSLMESFTTDDDTPYQAQYNTANHPLGGGVSNQLGINEEYSGAFGMLSPAEQQAFDAAVSMGNVNVANHYAIINHHRQIQLDNGTLSTGHQVALADAETPSGGSDNDNAPSHAEIIAATQDASNTQQQINQNNLASAQDAISYAASVNTDPDNEIYTGGGPMGGFKEGGLVNKKKKKK